LHFHHYLGCRRARARRPAPRLASFYVSLSFGGMLGSLFALAPYIFRGSPNIQFSCPWRALPPWPRQQRIAFWFSARRGAFVIFAFCRSTAQATCQLDMAVLSLAALSCIHARCRRVGGDRLALIVAQHTGQTSIPQLFGVNVVFDTDNASASCGTARPFMEPRSSVTESRARRPNRSPTLP
jgi:hypothetical protein